MLLRQLIVITLALSVLMVSRSALADTYPESTELLQQLAKRVISEMEWKTRWRFVPEDIGKNPTLEDLKKGGKYKKILWKPGDRQTVAVYKFHEEGTGETHPFAARFERQLGLAMDGSTKFLFVMRDLAKFDEMKYRETHLMIDEKTATAVGKVLGARYFLTG